jgi:predicted P-loop ATPase
MLLAALALVERGFAVFPLHGIVDGACTCGTDCGNNAGKHPIHKGGFKLATRDAQEVVDEWVDNPNANVGVRTGDGLLVLDVDPRNGGEAALEALAAEHPEVTDTSPVATGGGGLHLYFKVAGPAKWKKNIAVGLDIKADGGYVVGAGSRHYLGGVYENVGDTPIATAPRWLVNRAVVGAIKEVAAPTSEVVDLGALRARLVEVRRSKASRSDPVEKEKAAIIGRVLDGEPLAELGDRDNTINRVVAILAYQLPDGTPWAAVQEILRPSLNAMPRDTNKSTPETFEYLAGVARAKFEKKWAERVAFYEQRDAERARVNAFREAVQGRAAAAGRAAPTAEDLGEDWRDALLTSKRGEEPRACEANLDIILECAPETRGFIRWNAFTKKVEIDGGLFAGIDTNSVGGEVAGWMQREFGCFPAANQAGAAVVRVARRHSYDPIVEYLQELAWDGVPRLDSFLEDYFAADVEGAERAQYVRTVSRKWLIALVARALRPGCKVDSAIIFEGEQGVGKSTGLEALVGSAYFLDTSIDIGGKDALQAIAGAWLVELGELASLQRANDERTKQFITSRVDKFRPPYAPGMEDSPRRCVLAGTTNKEEDYLRDQTGNRRYWPVRVVGIVDVEGIARDRDQIFAEAVVAFKAGEKWHLVGSEVALAKAEAAKRLEPPALMERIECWWEEMKPSARPARMTVFDVASQLNIPLERVDHKLKTEMGSAMKALGFKRPHSTVGNERIRLFEPSKELRELPQRTSAQRAAHLALVEATKAKKPEGK